jgi:hypothetical protein
VYEENGYKQNVYEENGYEHNMYKQNEHTGEKRGRRRTRRELATSALGEVGKNQIFSILTFNVRSQYCDGRFHQ